MEEIATCISCGGEAWKIFFTRIECVGCGKEYKWPVDCKKEEETGAKDIIFLVNDNY